tara:strand:- start:211 stop:1026 length:816 start_codon:yes stop_codon:yes gene_type:complete
MKKLNPSIVPKVLPVVEPEGEKPKHHHEHLPNVGCGVAGGGSLLLMISPVKTGKSTIISNLLLNDNFYGQEFFDDVQIISNTIKNDVTSRFLDIAFNVYDYYDDAIIDGLIERQKGFEKKDQPTTALILDDCLGSIKRESKINHLCSRYRHFNIKLLVISSQKFKGAVSPIVRANATDVIIGSPFPNQKELLSVAEEYGDLFSGADNWLKLYRKATPNKYDFCYMDLQSNPPIMYSNFEKVIATGGHKEEEDSEVIDKVDTPISEDNKDNL